MGGLKGKRATTIIDLTIALEAYGRQSEEARSRPCGSPNAPFGSQRSAKTRQTRDVDVVR